MHGVAQILLVAFGSTLGGLARWGVSLACLRWLGAAFPWGTLVINVTGSGLLGWFMTVLSKRLGDESLTWLRAEDLRLLVAVGFCGAYTTFSTFEYETLILGGRSWLLAAAYVSVSVFVGLVALRAGVWLGGGA